MVKKTAIPVDATPVHSFSEARARIEGGTADDLAVQVVSALVKSLKVPQSVLSSLIAHHADGQYQAKRFLQKLKSSTQGANGDLPEGHNAFFVIPWDTAHYMDLRRLIKRANQFSIMFGKRKGYSEYKSFEENNEMTAHSTKNYATTGFASNFFSQFKGIMKATKLLLKRFQQQENQMTKKSK